MIRPRMLILDEPTEGIQPSIIKDIERVIRALAERGTMAILLCEAIFRIRVTSPPPISSCNAARLCFPAGARTWTRKPFAVT